MRINRSFLSCLISHFQSEAMFKTVDVVRNFTDSRLGVCPLWKKRPGGWGRLLWNVPMTWTLDTDKSRHFPGWGRFLTSLFCGRSLMLKQKPVGMSSTILLWLSASMHMGKYKHTFNICPTYGTYTRMLCRVLNTCWGDQCTNVELYGDLPTLSARIGFRRLDFASHCRRHHELPASQLVLWRPTHGHLLSYLRAGCLHKQGRI